MLSAEHLLAAPVRAPGMTAITTTGLTKAYGGRRVVDDLALEVPTGVVSGFVGPNGAGKTTTIRMLLGLVRPSAGSGTVLGEPLHAPHRFLHQVGAMIEGPAFTPGLSGADNLRVLAHAGRLPLERVAAVLDRVGLTSRAQDPFRSYSLGMKQRLGIAAALLPSPRLLVLDEPTNGLDPAGILQIRDLLLQFRDEGMTVLVSSHLLSEVEQVADHLVMIRAGRMLFQGTVADLLSRRPPTIACRPERSADAGRVAGLADELRLAARLQDDGEVVVSLPPSLSETQSLAQAAELNRRAHAVVAATLAVLLAPGQGVDTGAWFTGEGLAMSARTVLNVLLAAIGYATLGSALGILLRSAIPAVVIGFGWLFLLETIVAGSAPSPGRWLPGQILSAVATNGTPEIGFGAAIWAALGYLFVAAAAALAAFTRRDVTA